MPNSVFLRCGRLLHTTAISVVLACSLSVLAQVQTGAVSQTVPGTGNGQAIKTAQASPLVRSAYEFLVSQTFELSNDRLREQTYDAIANPETCILHRRSLTLADKQNIVAELLEAVMNFAPS